MIHTADWPWPTHSSKETALADADYRNLLDKLYEANVRRAAFEEQRHKVQVNEQVVRTLKQSVCTTSADLQRTARPLRRHGKVCQGEAGRIHGQDSPTTVPHKREVHCFPYSYMGAATLLAVRWYTLLIARLKPSIGSKWRGRRDASVKDLHHAGGCRCRFIRRGGRASAGHTKLQGSIDVDLAQEPCQEVRLIAHID